MVAVTSGTTSFSMDVDDLIIKASEPLGGEFISSNDASSARLTLNLILIELQNKNIPLSKIDTVSVPLLDSTAEYELDASILDVLKLTLKDTNDVEIPLTRYSQKQYHDITKKLQEGRPSCYTSERLKDNVVLKFWQVPPNDDEYTAELLVFKKIEDITASYQKVDLPTRYFPLLVRWLSYELSLNKSGVPQDIRAELKQNYLETLETTFEEDRERADLIIVPGGITGF